jgi:tetratricopeptide (TPR) repeat protein
MSMPTEVRGAPAAPSAPSWLAGALGAAIAVAVLLAYAGSLHGPFLYDDRTSIPFNESIRDLHALGQILHPPGGGATVSGRPFLNLTFALNYAFGGLDLRGYHLTNVLLHVAAALALYGLVRRTLGRPCFAEPVRRRRTWAAAGIALVWAPHPLQTESVTYLVQRAESLMGLLYLTTLYAFARSVDSSRPNGWRAVAVVACALGMATKENMVSAPLAVLLYDRAFVSGAIAAAWTRHRRTYAGLFATWAVLLLCLWTMGPSRGGSVGFGVGVSAPLYWLTQCYALVRYAALSVWPAPLVFDYGPVALGSVANAIVHVVAAAIVCAGSAWLLWKRPGAGWLCFVALAVLAPTSVLPGTTQMIVEHRMYLPLAAVVCALASLLLDTDQPRATLLGALAACCALGVATAARNRVYQSELAIWSDAAAKRPDNAVAHSSLGAALKNAGRRSEAMAEDRRALTLNPNYAPALANLALSYAESGELETAFTYASRAVAADPRNPQAHLNLGVTLDLLHRTDEAVPHYAEAVRLSPLLPQALNDYGDALGRTGHNEEGMAYLRRALELEPTYAEAAFNYAAAQVRAGDLPAGQATFSRAVSVHPAPGPAYLSWANFLLREGNTAPALEAYRRAAELAPDLPDVHYSFATALATAGRYEAAAAEYEAALRLKPDYAEAYNNLGNTLLALERPADAVGRYEAALKLRPDDAKTHNNLGLALAQTGRVATAAEHFRTALKLAPDFAEARRNLERAEAQLNPFGR